MDARRLALAGGFALVVALRAGAASAQGLAAGELRAGALSFDGHATVGNFIGLTHTLRGRHTAGARLADISGWVDAPVNTLRTGNNRRDRDMNKSLESERFPTIHFDLVRIIPADPQAAPAPGTELGAMLAGALTIHGVRRQVSIPARIRFDHGTTHVRGDFPVNLKDYAIGGLSKMLGVLRLDEHTVVHFDLTFAESGGP